ncbi:MAG TPA: CPBP family intramembrane glutamic endopeptidase [Candidatus Dormibacteraeota bacterium]
MSQASAAATLQRQPATVSARIALIVFCLVAGLGYRASVSLIPAGLAEVIFVAALAALLLAAALVAKRQPAGIAYWEIPYALFVFVAAALFGDGNVSPFQRLFVQDVLHESTSTNNPLAATVTGTVLAQLFGTAMLAIPIVALTKASGAGLESIFLSRPKDWLTLVIALIVFVALYVLTMRGRTVSFFPVHGDASTARFIAFTPALVVLVLLNGFREELWFRALFLKKYARLLGPVAANLLTAIVFVSFHVQVRYSASILPFLAYALLIGLVCGWMMQRSQSILASTIFHAGTDIPIFLVYLSWTS